MTLLKLSIIDKDKNVRAEREREKETYLEYLFAYEEGDKIILTLEEKNQYIVVQLDEALAPTFLYVRGNKWVYEVPIDKKSREAYSPKVFSGNSHYLKARLATEEEINQYRNLALNPHDQKNESGVYPHAKANVETRNDATFFARNAIDGVIANESHGSYPYQSWGINQQKNAEITVDFGRTVEIDQLVIVLRADFPHDSYWTQVTAYFSDGSEHVLTLEKVLEPQDFHFQKRKVKWVKLGNLIKADDESPFPALTQLEVYGINVGESKNKSE